MEKAADASRQKLEIAADVSGSADDTAIDESRFDIKEIVYAGMLSID
mgnify:CR=1 FL=1